MSQVRKDAMSMGERSAAVAMGQTRLGTVYLYELGVDDLEAYVGAPGSSARGRLRWLLPRIAGKGPTGGARLSEQEIATLDEEEVESLLETYLASPDNQRHAAEAGRGLIPMVRGGGESAVSFLDRLVRWRVQALRNPAPGAGTEVSGAPGATRADALPRLMSWTVIALVLAIASSALAAWLAWQAAQHAAEERAARERWQSDMKALLEWNAAATEKSVRELTEEVARLRRRLEAAEGGSPKPAARAPAPAKGAPPKTPAPRRETPPRR